MSTTWNPLDKPTDVGVSDGDLTATYTGGSIVDNITRSVHPLGVGKFYFENDVTSYGAAGHGTVAFGVANASENPNSGSIAGNGAVGYFTLIGSIYGFNGALGSGYPSGVNGTPTDVAVDTVIKRMWWRVGTNWFGSSNSTPGDPDAGTNGLDISSISGSIFAACECGSIPAAFTTKFARSAWTRANPSTFGEINAPLPRTRAYGGIFG